MRVVHPHVHLVALAAPLERLGHCDDPGVERIDGLPLLGLHVLPLLEYQGAPVDGRDVEEQEVACPRGPQVLDLVRVLVKYLAVEDRDVGALGVEAVSHVVDADPDGEERVVRRPAGRFLFFRGVVGEEEVFNLVFQR